MDGGGIRTNRREAVKQRMFRIITDTQEWKEPAGQRTAIETQHDYRRANRSARTIRVVEFFTPVVVDKERQR